MMIEQNDIREWILDYCVCEREDRERIREYVMQHPEWSDCFEIALKWDRMLDDARALANPDRDEATLPFLIATDTMTTSARNPYFRSALDRLRRRVISSGRLADSIDLFRRRRARIDLVTDAAEHFERTTGSSVRELPQIVFEDGGSSVVDDRRMQIAPHALRSPVARRAVHAVSVAMGVYLMLFFASTYRDSPLERIAHIRSNDLTWSQIGDGMRGKRGAWSRYISAQYDMALSEVAASTKTFLGLFPSYRYAGLRRARTLLKRAMHIQATRETVPAKAYTTLAKLHFLLGDSSLSLDALKELIRIEERNGVSAWEPEPSLLE